MSDALLLDAIGRAERALDRIERAVARPVSGNPQDVALRDKVRGVVAELDEMIRTAGASS